MKSEARVAVLFALLVIGSQAVHWLITPHAGASRWRTVAVIVQAIFGFGASWWLYRADRRGTTHS
jgi:hypothetical protein